MPEPSQPPPGAPGTSPGAPGPVADATADMARLVPELLVSDHARSLAFYTGVLGFRRLYGRDEEGFSFLDLDGAQVMIEELDPERRNWVAGPLEPPFGRGMNLEIACADAGLLQDRAVAAGCAPFLPLEERWYRRDEVEIGVRQFIVQDPDGYLLRLSEDIGTRPAC